MEAEGQNRDNAASVHPVARNGDGQVRSRVGVRRGVGVLWPGSEYLQRCGAIVAKIIESLVRPDP